MPCDHSDDIVNTKVLDKVYIQTPFKPILSTLRLTDCVIALLNKVLVIVVLFVIYYNRFYVRSVIMKSCLISYYYMYVLYVRFIIMQLNHYIQIYTRTHTHTHRDIYVKPKYTWIRHVFLYIKGNNWAKLSHHCGLFGFNILTFYKI